MPVLERRLIRLPNQSLAPLSCIGADHSVRLASTARAMQLMSGRDRSAATLLLCWMVQQATACVHCCRLRAHVHYAYVCTPSAVLESGTQGKARFTQQRCVATKLKNISSTPGRWRRLPRQAWLGGGPAGSRRRGCLPRRSCSRPSPAPPAATHGDAAWLSIQQHALR